MALNLKRLKKNDIIHVVWEDANTAGGWQAEPTDAADGKCTVNSAGIFVRISKDKHLVMVWSSSGQAVNDVHFLPLAMLRSVKKVGHIG